ELFGELMQDDQTLRHIVDLLQGNDVRYPMTEDRDAHPLIGGWAPELTVVARGVRSRLSQLMHRARGVLLDFCDSQPLRGQVVGWSERIDVITAACPSGAPADALLIRPDGYVAWAGAAGVSLDRSLRRWFGAPASGPNGSARYRDSF